MDILRLPSSLRGALLQAPAFQTCLRRAISASTRPLDAVSAKAETPTETPRTPPASTVNSYKHTAAPNDAQLKYAEKFFRATQPRQLFTAATFRLLPQTPFPEVALIGRSNVGKSSLINALLDRNKAKLARTGQRAGVTQTMSGYGVAGGLAYSTAKGNDEWRRFPAGGLVLLDMPGYGIQARAEWGGEALKMLGRRRTLRRVFVLLDAKTGVKESDLRLLQHFHQSAIPFSIVLTKIDRVARPIANNVSRANLDAAIRALTEEFREEIDRHIMSSASIAAIGKALTRRGTETVGDILCTTAEKPSQLRPRGFDPGLDALRWAILSACGMESDVLGRKKRTRELNLVEENDLTGLPATDAQEIDIGASEDADVHVPRTQYNPMF